MVKLIRLAVVAAFVFGGWLLASLSIYFIRVPTPHKYLPVNIQLVTKKRLTFNDTWVDLSKWTVADLKRHQEFVDRLEEAGKGDLLRHAAEAILVENPPKMTVMPAPRPAPARGPAPAAAPAKRQATVVTTVPLPEPEPEPKPKPTTKPADAQEPPKEKPKVASEPPPPAPKEKPYKRKPFPDEIPVPPDEAYWDEPA